jgi:hypothetical protein
MRPAMWALFSCLFHILVDIFSILHTAKYLTTQIQYPARDFTVFFFSVSKILCENHTFKKCGPFSAIF